MHTIADLNAGALNGVSRLQISENLTEFPEKILDLAETLETLDLSGNRLSALPADFARLTKLKVLFLSNNEFEVLPSVLGACPSLSMIGFKANRIDSVPENALPKDTRWLILTDNKITVLPESMGSLHRLQKFMLAGNKLTTLPASMEKCRSLELVRLSANNFHAMPDFIFKMPKLAWIAFSGNPFCQTFDTEAETLPKVRFSDFVLTEELGRGASGVIIKATRVARSNDLPGTDLTVAVKKFNGQVTSDGYPQDELRACVAAGKHRNLVELIAQIEEPQQMGLVMSLIDQNYGNLGSPPTLDSCTRDHFGDGVMFTVSAMLKIVRNIAGVMIHLHGKGIAHGDLYAHNILVNDQAEVLLGDFGAASSYASLRTQQAIDLQRIEVRAFGCLLDDLLGCASNAKECKGAFESLELLKNRCMGEKVLDRPTFVEIKAELDELKG